MRIMQIDIIGVSETFWKDPSDFIYSLPDKEEFLVIYSGGNVGT